MHIRCLGRRLAFPTVRNFVEKKCTDDVKPIKMAYNIFKSAHTDDALPPLMILHGLFGSKRNWKSISRGLAKKTTRPIISLDARNHGDSPHTDRHGPKYLAADIVHLIKEMGLKKASLMGHSMGARAVMLAALKYPQVVEGIIIVDTSPVTLYRDFAGLDEIFKVMQRLQVPKELSMSDGFEYAKNEMKKTVASTITVEFVLLNLKKQSDGSFKWVCNVDGLKNNISTELSEFKTYISGAQPYTGPVMFICGNRTNFVDPKSGPLIKNIFPKAEIHWLDAGHLVHIEQFENTLNLVVRFLKHECTS